ncbi:mercuric reductase [Candidatus Poribacteria bacterium]|nr:mercuric reductase [Candidatus Poribacteria bacterium]
MTEVVEVSPRDEYNAELIANVHPQDWVNPEPAQRYNLVVIGAGTAGLVTAAGAAGLGAKVALVEKHLLGGDCLNVGCVPSKCLIRSSRAYADVRNAHQFGVTVHGSATVDFSAVMERVRRRRAHISHHDSVKRFRDMGVDVFLGEGRFSGPHTVEVAGRTLRFKKAVIATGARAVRPPIEGLVEAGYLTNENVFSLTERPPRLAVLGAGPLGCELAQAFRRLGSEVYLIDLARQILIREDPEAADIVAEAFLEDGIKVMLNSSVKRVIISPQGKVVHFESSGVPGSITVDEILVGAGRAPNVENLNLEAAGVEYDRRQGVLVDDTLRSTGPGIYAAGDVCSSYKFTHAADAAARIVIRNALFWGRKKLSALSIPWCTYTDPEVAHVGMYEKEASDRGIRIETFTRRLNEVDRAITDGEERGFVKVHVRKGTDTILGATVVARHAGEIISEITLAMATHLGLGAIANVVHPYPTQAEAIKHVADAYNRTRLTPIIKGLFARLLAWQR